MSQFGSNTNFVSKINSVKYDLNSLFVSSGLVNRGNNDTTRYTGNTNLETVTFTKEGNYIVLLTGTPNNDNDKQTRYQLIFSTTSQGFTTGTTGELNAIYIQNFLGGGGNPKDATVSGCAVINVSSSAYTWYLALRINGSDGTSFRYQLSIIGPI